MSLLLTSNLDFSKLQSLNQVIQNLSSAPSSPVEGQIYFDTTLHQFGSRQNSAWVYLGSGGGTVTTLSVASSNGFAGTVATATSTPVITMTTSITGVLKGNGTAISAATAGTDFSTPSSTDTLTNKTFNATGTGNSLSNIATSMFATNVVDTDGTLAANSDTRLASQKAIVTYVQSNIQGVQWKAPVRAATTANGTLASAYANSSVIDGVTLVTGDRILLKNQTTGADNGIYTVNASGAPTRATDADANTEIKGLVVDVLEGTANADTAWINTNTGTVTIGTTSLTFVDFVKTNVPTATTSIAGKVTLATQAQAEAKSDTSAAVVSADLVNFPLKKTFTIGDGSTTAITCTHSLGTQDITLSVRDATTNAAVLVDWTSTSTSVATVTFAVAPASNAYKVVIIG